MWLEEGAKIYSAEGAGITVNILKRYRDGNWSLVTTSTDAYDTDPIVINANVTGVSTFAYVHGIVNRTYVTLFNYIAWGYC